MLAVVLSYKIGKILGKGTYAEVYEASRNGAMHAVKVISKNRIQNIPISNEIDALKSIGHKNIIKMHDFYETKDHLYLFLDLCVGGELFDRIIEKEVFTEKEASCIVSDILEAVNYLHSNGIVHRDIKPENILYRTKSPDSDLVLTDFGMSKIITQNFALNCGTPGYMAPEVLKEERYGKAVDMWSVGVIVFVLLSGRFPFSQREGSKYEEDELYQIVNCIYDFDGFEQVSTEAQEFISRMLLAQPEIRMTATEALKHDWISKFTNLNHDMEAMSNLKISFNAAKAFRTAVEKVRIVNYFNKPSDQA